MRSLVSPPSLNEVGIYPSKDAKGETQRCKLALGFSVPVGLGMFLLGMGWGARDSSCPGLPWLWKKYMYNAFSLASTTLASLLFPRSSTSSYPQFTMKFIAILGFQSEPCSGHSEKHPQTTPESRKPPRKQLAHSTQPPWLLMERCNNLGGKNNQFGNGIFLN